MILSDGKISARLNKLVSIEKSALCTEDGVLSQINPNSLDLTIDSLLLYPVVSDDAEPIIYGITDMERKYRRAIMQNGGIILEPGDCVLCQSREYITMPSDLCGQVFTKSTLGRLFVNHMMAGVIDAGFHGNITFELKNEGNHKIFIQYGSRICQLVFMELSEPAKNPYGERETSRYHGQELPYPALPEKKEKIENEQDNQ